MYPCYDRTVLERVDRVIRERQDMPVYREHYADVDIPAIDSFEDLQRVPLLSKEDAVVDSTGGRQLLLRQLGGDTVNCATTSGTSGNMALIPRTAADQRARDRQREPRLDTHYPEGSRTVLVQNPQWVAGVKTFLEERDRFVAVGNPTDIAFSRDLVAATDADTLYTTTSLAMQLGRALADTAYARDTMERIILGGEGLSDAARTEIERTFPDADILRTYGAREMGGAGFQCPELFGTDRYHVDPDLHLFEVVDPDDGTPRDVGEEGELVVTNLWTDAGMAFTRYRTGDAARMEPASCDCGRIAPVIHVTGKLAFQRIHLQGVTIDRATFESALEQVQDLVTGAYQIHVHEEKRDGQVLPGFRVQLVPRMAFSDMDRVRDQIADRLMQELQVSTEYTWQDAVEKGVLLPIDVELVDSPGEGSKTRPVVDHR